MSGAQDSRGKAEGASSPDYRNAVERLKTGEDLLWTASPPVVAEALNEALNTVRAERDRFRSALETIRREYGQVCEVYEVCEHAACFGSYGAWATADEALSLDAPSIPPEASS